MRSTKLIALVGIVIAVSAGVARGHCDGLDGPVVRDARQALEQGSSAVVLKWVTADDEAEVRRVFEQALRVRAHGGEAQELADRHFFETLVRLHRAAEGAPYTGLKPAGTPVPPPVTAVDAALEAGSVDTLVARLQARVEQEVRRRFETAANHARDAGADVEAGRRAVHAYVELVHYVKGLHDALHAEHGNDGHAGHPAHAHP